MKPFLALPEDVRTFSGVYGVDPQHFKKLVLLCEEMFIQVHEVPFAHMVALNPKRSTMRFQTIEHLLQLVLLQLKAGITFDLLGYIFSIDASNAHEKFQNGLELLNQALNIEGFIPRRKFRDVDEFNAVFENETRLIIDGTEQAIQRPMNKERQKATYTGKKKRNTLKVLIISTMDRYIHYVSPVHVGTTSDFRILKEQFLPGADWFKNFEVYVDLGFVGFDKQYPEIDLTIPHKRKSKTELTEQQKEENRQIASQRIRVEHAIGNMKRFDILSNTCRFHNLDLYDLVVETVAGLSNLRQPM